MIITREMFLVIVLAGFALFVFFLISDRDIVLIALAIAGIAFVATQLKKDKLVMEGE